MPGVNLKRDKGRFGHLVNENNARHIEKGLILDSLVIVIFEGSSLLFLV